MQAQRITLDAAQIHAQFGRKLMQTLRRRMSEADAEDVYQNLLVLISTTAKHSFDPAKSPLGPFLFGVLLRNAISAYFQTRNAICGNELQARDAASDEENDSVSLFLASAGECDTAETKVALDWFERAVGRELADTELTVFQGLGVAGVLENSAEDRAILCLDLGMQDQSVVKIINRIKRVVADLWPAHFDVPLPCSRPLRTVEAVPPAPALAIRMPMQQLDLFAAHAVSAPVSAPAATAEAPAAPAAELGCPMPPVAKDPIVVRLPVPVLELVKAQGKAAAVSASWPGFAGSRSQGQALRQAA